ncbi:CopG family transcriptional regulator [Acidobacteria bacterium AH-259-D05]|nr:CopG family transcriptional regulator [Acidobacteria bacterium AH-259-D05]
MASTTKRATIYFQPEIHRALRVKAAETDRSVSDLVNEAVRLTLTEDVEDLAAFEQRAGEPDLVFERVLKDLRRRGTI